MSKFMFITDLDNTLVGDSVALAELNQQLSAHRKQHGTLIVYSTGRSPTLYKQLRQEQDMIEPDFTVLSVGTLIYPGGSDGPDAEWSNILSDGWDREAVVATTAHFSDLVPQPDSEQTPHKASYFLQAAIADELLPQLKGALTQKGLEIQLVYSSGKDLDILPKRGNKGAAVAFLQQRLGMPQQSTVVCGDSGNDLSMFQAANAKGIIVGNARDELREWHQREASSDVYLAQASCAGGILEGLKHFGFLQSAD
ncbi:MAG: sucrose-phosphate phosphatase [Elainellaceae cyanobacterium]